MKVGALGLIVIALFSPVAAGQEHVSRSEPLVVVQNGRYGYINHNGETVIPPQFLWGEDFEGGYGTVYVCGRLVSIDEAGQFSPFKYSHRKGGLWPLRSGGKVGFVDDVGVFKIPAVFADALPFSDGLAAVKVEESWGFINTTGHEVIQPVFEEAYYFREGVAYAEKDGERLLIDKKGKVLAKGYEQLQGIVAESRIPVSRDGKSGFLDLHGEVVIPLEYDQVNMFSEGLAPVLKGNKWEYIDRAGRLQIPFTFTDAGLFASGLAPARTTDRSGFINHSGKFAFNLQFDYAPGFLTGDAEGVLTAASDVSRFWTADRRFGYVNTSGKIVWGPAEESPDHAPLLGWSDEDRVASCEGVSEGARALIASFPN